MPSQRQHFLRKSRPVLRPRFCSTTQRQGKRCTLRSRSDSREALLATMTQLKKAAMVEAHMRRIAERRLHIAYLRIASMENVAASTIAGYNATTAKDGSQGGFRGCHNSSHEGKPTASELSNVEDSSTARHAQDDELKWRCSEAWGEQQLELPQCTWGWTIQDAELHSACDVKARADNVYLL